MASTLSALLVEDRVVTFRQMDLAVQRQRSLGGRIGTNLIELGHIDENQLLLYLSRVRSVPAIDRDALARVPASALRKMTRAQVKQIGALPFADQGVLSVAVVDPLEGEALDELTDTVRMPVRQFIVPEFRYWELSSFFYGVDIPPRFRDTIAQLRPWKLGIIDDVVRPSIEHGSPMERPRRPGDSAVIGLTWSIAELVQFYSECESRDEMVGATLGFLGKFFARRAILVVQKGEVRGFAAVGFQDDDAPITSIQIAASPDSALGPVCGGDTYFLGSPADVGFEAFYTGMHTMPPRDCALLPVKVGPRAALLIAGDNGDEALDPRLLAMVFVVTSQLSAALTRLILRQKRQKTPAKTRGRTAGDSASGRSGGGSAPGRSGSGDGSPSRTSSRLHLQAELSERSRIRASLRDSDSNIPRGMHRIPDRQWTIDEHEVLSQSSGYANAPEVPVDIHFDPPPEAEPPVYEMHGPDDDMPTNFRVDTAGQAELGADPPLEAHADDELHGLVDAALQQDPVTAFNGPGDQAGPRREIVTPEESASIGIAAERSAVLDQSGFTSPGGDQGSYPPLAGPSFDVTGSHPIAEAAPDFVSNAPSFEVPSRPHVELPGHPAPTPADSAPTDAELRHDPFDVHGLPASQPAPAAHEPAVREDPTEPIRAADVEQRLASGAEPPPPHTPAPQPVASQQRAGTLFLSGDPVNAALQGNAPDQGHGDFDGPTYRIGPNDLPAPPRPPVETPVAAEHAYAALREASARPQPGGEPWSSPPPPVEPPTSRDPMPIEEVGRLLQPSTVTPAVGAADSGISALQSPLRPTYITGEQQVADVADIVSRYATAVFERPPTAAQATRAFERPDEAALVHGSAAAGPPAGATRAMQPPPIAGPAAHGTQALAAYGTEGGATISNPDLAAALAGHTAGIVTHPGATMAEAAGLPFAQTGALPGITAAPGAVRAISTSPTSALPTPTDPGSGHAAQPQQPLVTGRHAIAMSATVQTDLQRLDPHTLVAQLGHSDRRIVDLVLVMLSESVSRFSDAIVAAFPGPMGRGRRANVAAGVPLEAHGPLIHLICNHLGLLAPRLRAHLESPSADTRFYAAQIIARGNDLGAIPALGQRLFDRDEQVRLTALRYLETVRQDPGFALVLQGIRAQLRNPDPWYVEGAIALVLHFRDLGGIPFLIEALDVVPPPVGEKAGLALTRLTFQDHATNARKWEKWWRRSGNEDRRRWLLDAMVDPSRTIRENAGREIRGLPNLVVNYNPDLDKASLKVAQRAVERYLFGK